MKKLMMFLTIGFVSFNVSATEIYSCSFNERVHHIIPGATIDEGSRKYLKNLVDTVKKGEVSTVTYIIEGDKAFVKDSVTNYEATFIRTSYPSSDWPSSIVHNVLFTEKSGAFPSATIISGDFAVRTTVFEERAFEGISVWTTYGKCIKSIL
tara:strand:+ start:282 stop:737 length:456 start_codon:yes stop_codon:yes gene_type:complete